LSIEDMQIIEAENGRVCIEKIRSAVPDVLVLDMMMPEMDGFDVLEILRNDVLTAALPVIIVTAKDLTQAEKIRLNQYAVSVFYKSGFTSQDLLKEIGKRAFRNDPKKGRIKSPEMISDVVATQWFLWHALASMDPNGVTQGQSWQSQLSVPTPMVMRKARDVTYTLQQITDTDQGPVAEIHSSFSLSQEKAPRDWPIPYAGRFRASGPFGFL
ncbi:MAG: response regulator, partial [Planctomycetes bacterium]|nr:response regulator [Planctomycetota bacterium]